MSELAIYGKREDVLALSQRLQATIPGGRRLTQDEALSLAQLSVAHGLDPFNGEAWIIPGSGLMVGIKGLRKAAMRAAKEEDGMFWTEFISVSPEKYGEPETSIVYECKLRDTITTQSWAKSINLMTTAGVPYKDAIQAVGEAPLKIGIGIAKPEEKSKMPIHQRAKKRAEADAIKQRYDVALNAEFSDEEPQIINAEFQSENKEPRDEDTILTELGFTVEPQGKDTFHVKSEMNLETGNIEIIESDIPIEVIPINDDIYQSVVDAGYSDNTHAAKALMQNYCKTGYDTVQKAVDWARLYRGWKDSGLNTVEAADLANAGKAPK